MPWTEDDGPKRHTKKANTAPKRRQWSDTANNVRSREMSKGVSEKDAEAKAVRVANAAVKNHPSKKKKAR